MRRYIIAHWRGELGLARSFILNGIVLYLLLVVGGGAVGLFIEHLSPRTFGILNGSQPVVFALLAAFMACMVWACVGILRCGVRYVFDRSKLPAYRLGGMIAVVGVLLVAYFTAEDLYNLILKPLVARQ